MSEYHEHPISEATPLWRYRHGCPVVIPEPCTWEGRQEDCPDHGIAAYYRRCAQEGRDSGD